MSLTAALKKLYRWKFHKDGAIQFVRDNFGVEPDPWQVDVLMAYMVENRIAMKACKGPGKTCVLAWIAWHFMTCYPQAKVAATSISWNNLADGLWSEMSKWQQKSPFLKAQFVWTKSRIFQKDYPETWFMSARAWAKGSSAEQQANTLAGLHADYIMFILDESGGIPDAVMAAAEAALANDHGGSETRGVLVQAGNPTHLSGPLYRACSSERHLWYVIEISSDPDSPKRTPRVSVKWAREQIEKYGRDNPWVLVNVFGQFPPNSLNTLLGVDEVNAAMRREPDDKGLDKICRKVGLDVARFGDDRTIFFPRQGLFAFKPIEMRNARTNDIAARGIQIKNKWDYDGIYIDDTGGYGGGVIDSMIQSGYAPHGINMSGKAQDPRYFNRRAEMWFRMAEWIKAGGALPNIPEIVGELTTPTYTFSNGKFQLQPKDLIKKELGRSPDLADALALTFAELDFPRLSKLEKELGVSKRGKINLDYDPMKM
ncbi:hypothetical protein ACES2L_05985 [Bdellovibrio bacteriovorus]